MAGKPKAWVSEAAQTVFRDSESQFLWWDITEEPSRHPSKFPRGRGLHYPVLYDPAWPVHIAAPKKVVKAPELPKKKVVIGSYALTGITLSETERRPIKKTLVFPHRNTDLPFRQPLPKVAKDQAYEPCKTLTLKAVEMLESKIIFKSILEKIPQYDKNDKIAHETIIRKVLQLQHVNMGDPSPPIPRRRKSKHRCSRLKDTSKDIQYRQNSVASVEILFVDEGLSCGIHGTTIEGLKAKNCEIHGDSGIVVDEKRED